MSIFRRGCLFFGVFQGFQTLGQEMQLMAIILHQLIIMDIKTQRIALLVDGDNAQAKIMELILEEASKYGKVTIRRVYGDWTTQQMNHWKNILNEMAFLVFQNGVLRYGPL